MFNQPWKPTVPDKSCIANCAGYYMFVLTAWVIIVCCSHLWRSHLWRVSGRQKLCKTNCSRLQGPSRALLLSDVLVGDTPAALSIKWDQGTECYSAIPKWKESQHRSCILIIIDLKISKALLHPIRAASSQDPVAAWPGFEGFPGKPRVLGMNLGFLVWSRVNRGFHFIPDKF